MNDGTLDVRREITSSNGQHGKAVNHWTLVDGKNCEWRSSKCSLGRERLSNIPMTTLQKE